MADFQAAIRQQVLQYRGNNALFSNDTQNFPFNVFPPGKKFYVYQKPVHQECDSRPSDS
jgi:hypothetical protein